MWWSTPTRRAIAATRIPTSCMAAAPAAMHCYREGVRGSRNSTSQLTAEPPDSLRDRVIADPEVLGDRPEPPTAPTHLRRLGADPLVHWSRRGNPQLDLDPQPGQGAKPLRTCRRPDRTRPRDQQVRPLGSRRRARAIKIRGSPGQSPRRRSMMIAKGSTGCMTHRGEKSSCTGTTRSPAPACWRPMVSTKCTAVCTWTAIRPYCSRTCHFESSQKVA